MKKDAVVIANMVPPLYNALRKGVLHLPWELKYNDAKNVAASHHELLQLRRRRLVMSRTSAAMHLPYPASLESTSSFSSGPEVQIDDDAMVSQTAVIYE